MLSCSLLDLRNPHCCSAQLIGGLVNPGKAHSALDGLDQLVSQLVVGHVRGQVQPVEADTQRKRIIVYLTGLYFKKLGIKELEISETIRKMNEINYSTLKGNRATHHSLSIDLQVKAPLNGTQKVNSLTKCESEGSSWCHPTSQW